LIRGVGEYYGEPLTVQEPSCMLDGDEQCEILVSRTDEE
jgi:predicted hydrocarbon binding protein